MNTTHKRLLALIILAIIIAALSGCSPTPPPCGATTACYLCDGWGNHCYCGPILAEPWNTLLINLSEVAWYNCAMP